MLFMKLGFPVENKKANNMSQVRLVIIIPEVKASGNLNSLFHSHMIKKIDNGGAFLNMTNEKTLRAI